MATDSEFYPKDDHSWKTWMFQEYLQVRGPLTEENVMEYFEESFIFDRSSNNNVLRMQTQHADPNVRMSRLETEAELKRFTGKEYALVHAQPPLFVIQQRDRISPVEFRPTAVYFILNNVLYTAPDLYTLMSTKLTNALNMIQTSLDTLRAAKPDYTPRIGHAWPIVDVPKPKIPGKGHGGTRQASLIPGTPADLSLAGTSKQQTADNNKPPEEDEEKQVWEPFALAFYSTRAEVEKKRAAALVAAANARSGDPMEPGLDNMSKRVNVPPAVSSDAIPSSSALAANTTAKSFTVPTADAPTPNKQKGTPGPPGKPGHGKKKQRRIEKQASKQGTSQTVPATPI